MLGSTMRETLSVLGGLAEIADRYEVLLCDVWGVVHDGVAPYPGTPECLKRFRGERGPVVLISNAPRPTVNVRILLDRLGVPAGCYDALITSGDVTRAELAARAPGPAYHLGPERDLPLFEGTGLELTGVEAARFMICTGLAHDTEETPEDYRDRLATAHRHGLLMICANPDVIVMRGGNSVYCAGSLARLYEALGGEVLYAGKPYPVIYARALELAGSARGHGVEPSQVLAVGDGAETDIAGANGAGLDALFVAGGIHARELLGANGVPDAEAARRLLDKAGVRAVAALPRLVW